ncbi:hypothetical protein HDU93_010042 [Gonapodya sp. JEL0774]|nr:hypothetical protein HDU93_010042 [Gonapodya sp. JEL0774]
MSSTLDKSLDDIIKQQNRSSTRQNGNRRGHNGTGGERTARTSKGRSAPYAVPAKVKAKEAKDAKVKEATAAANAGMVTVGLLSKKQTELLTANLSKKISERRLLEETKVLSGGRNGRAAGGRGKQAKVGTGFWTSGASKVQQTKAAEELKVSAVGQNQVDSGARLSILDRLGSGFAQRQGSNTDPVNRPSILDRLGTGTKGNQQSFSTPVQQAPPLVFSDAPRRIAQPTSTGSLNVTLNNTGPPTPSVRNFVEAVKALGTDSNSRITIKGRGGVSAQNRLRMDQETGRQQVSMIPPASSDVEFVEDDDVMDVDDGAAAKSVILSRISVAGAPKVSKIRPDTTISVGLLKKENAATSTASRNINHEQNQSLEPQQTPLSVSSILPPPVNDDVGTTVTISNLHPEATEEDIRATFGALGTLLDCFVYPDPKDSSVGRCEIRFLERSAAEEAVNTYNGMTADGKNLQVEIREIKKELNIVGRNKAVATSVVPVSTAPKRAVLPSVAPPAQPPQHQQPQRFPPQQVPSHRQAFRPQPSGQLNGFHQGSLYDRQPTAPPRQPYYPGPGQMYSDGAGNGQRVPPYSRPSRW